MSCFRILTAFALAVSGWAAKPSEWQDLRMYISTTLHVPDPLPSLRDKNYGQFPLTPDVVADRVSYATSYDLRVPALVYHTPGATVVQHPAIVIVNGRGEDKSAAYDYWAGILYARAGAVVLAYDPIGEYERNSERRSGATIGPVSSDSMAKRLMGLMVTDVAQAVQYMASRKDVDPARIAVLGSSVGSLIASLSCAIDMDIHVCVLAGSNDWDKIPGISNTEWPTIMALNAKRGPTLIWNGAQDVPPGLLEKLHSDTVARLGSAKGIFQFGLTQDSQAQAFFLTRAVALWLNDKLRFPNWSKKQIETLPEQNWDGLTALGDHLPTVARQDLHAIPDAVWVAEKESYVYETWLERAKAAAAGPTDLKTR